jgi:hypothetical protein
MFGGPSKAQNITVIRPFSGRCATVSEPLPVGSSHANVCSFDDPERPGQAAGREVDQPVAGERRCGHEEQVLPLDELPQPAVDTLVDLAHGRHPSGTPARIGTGTWLPASGEPSAGGP